MTLVLKERSMMNNKKVKTLIVGFIQNRASTGNAVEELI
jgi:hypothetical protein